MSILLNSPNTLVLLLMSEQVRVRFAPSPTGNLHIGGLRTALYNYLFAKKNNGKFIIRIEDTDRERFVENATEHLLEVLKIMDLPPDEGVYLENGQVKQKGEFGPYIQSERLEIYKNYAQQLVDSGHAYYCFCSAEDLVTMREAQTAAKQIPKYDRRCLKLSKEQIKEKLDAGVPHVIRLKVPEEGSTSFNDLVRGEVTFKHIEIDDSVLMKSDGFPTYHLANVVDDHLMQISHVIRGEEWLPSTPKHVLLYQAFGWDLPIFAHLPLLLSTTHAKLSKRQGDVAAEDYLNHGYLPQAILNFVMLLGWNPGTEQEIFTLDELIQAFSLDRVGKAGAVVDLERLGWFNGIYIRSIVHDRETRKDEYESLLNKAKQYMKQANDAAEFKLIDTQLELAFLMQAERLKKLEDLSEINSFLFKLPDYNHSLLIFKKSDNEKTKLGLESALKKISEIGDWGKESIKQALEEVKTSASLNPGDVFWPVRVALSGLESSPPPEEIAEVLGKAEALKRLEKAIKAL